MTIGSHNESRGSTSRNWHRPRCHNCNKVGHVQVNCWHRLQDMEDNYEEEEENPQILYVEDQEQAPGQEVRVLTQREIQQRNYHSYQ